MLKYIPWTREIYEELVSYKVFFSPDFKTQETCNETVRNKSRMLSYIPDHLKTQELCIEAVEKCAWLFEDVPDHLKA